MMWANIEDIGRQQKSRFDRPKCASKPPIPLGKALTSVKK